jgi:hypothetical protein
LCLATTFVDQGQGVIRRAANGPVVSLKTCSTPALEPSSTNSLALLKAYIEAKEQNIRYRLAAANGTDRCLVIDTGSGASLSVNAAGSLASANNCTGPFDPAKKMAPVMAGAKWVMSTEPPAQKAASASPPVSPATTPATPAISPAGQPPSGRQPAQAGTYNVTMNDITPRFWQFGRADGSLIAPRVQLMADGKIIGHANSNETSWGLENGAVVLYNAAKKPTTKFISMSNAAGKVTLSGPFIPAPQHVHVLTALTPSTARMEDITKRLWKFGRGDGSVIAPSVRLMPDGKIVGYAHPNEASWKLDNGAVVLLNQAGQPTSRFDSMIINGAAVTLSGPFLAQPQVTVVLTEVGMAP